MPEDDSSYSDEVARELEKLRAYHQSLEEEFKNADPDDPATAAKARAKIVELVPDAGETIANLMKFSESDAVRAGLARFVFTVAIKQAEKNGDEDELSKLIKELTGGKKSTD